eukprot:15101549-Ditylum_brightwellii.AAC.1
MEQQNSPTTGGTDNDGLFRENTIRLNIDDNRSEPRQKTSPLTSISKSGLHGIPASGRIEPYQNRLQHIVVDCENDDSYSSDDIEVLQVEYARQKIGQYVFERSKKQAIKKEDSPSSTPTQN